MERAEALHAADLGSCMKVAYPTRRDIREGGYFHLVKISFFMSRQYIAYKKLGKLTLTPIQSYPGLNRTILAFLDILLKTSPSTILLMNR